MKEKKISLIFHAVLNLRQTFPLKPRFQTYQHHMTQHMHSVRLHTIPPDTHTTTCTVKLLSNMAVGQRKRSQVKLPHRHSKLDPHFPLVIISLLDDPACLSVCLFVCCFLCTLTVTRKISVQVKVI